ETNGHANQAPPRVSTPPANGNASSKASENAATKVLVVQPRSNDSKTSAFASKNATTLEPSGSDVAKEPHRSKSSLAAGGSGPNAARRCAWQSDVIVHPAAEPGVGPGSRSVGFMSDIR